jgi:sensor histidine kinase YesM
MRLENDTLIVEVADNGVGIEQSKALKTPQQRKQHSVGMSNTATRIALLNDLYRLHISVSITPFASDATHPGTRVLIAIPKSKHTAG